METYISPSPAVNPRRLHPITICRRGGSLWQNMFGAHLRSTTIMAKANKSLKFTFWQSLSNPYMYIYSTPEERPARQHTQFQSTGHRFIYIIKVLLSPNFKEATGCCCSSAGRFICRFMTACFGPWWFSHSMPILHQLGSCAPRQPSPPLPLYNIGDFIEASIGEGFLTANFSWLH